MRVTQRLGQIGIADKCCLEVALQMRGHFFHIIDVVSALKPNAQEGKHWAILSKLQRQLFSVFEGGGDPALASLRSSGAL